MVHEQQTGGRLRVLDDGIAVSELTVARARTVLRRLTEQCEYVVIAAQSPTVLSAVGLIASELRRDLVRSVLLSGAKFTSGAVAEEVEDLVARGREELAGADDTEVRAAFDLRYAGQAFELTIGGDPRPDPAELRRAFDAVHEERYGYSDPDAELELVTVRVAVAHPAAELPPGAPPEGEERATREAIFEGRRADDHPRRQPGTGRLARLQRARPNSRSTRKSPGRRKEP